MSYKCNPYLDKFSTTSPFEHIDDEQTIYAYGAVPDTSKSWLVQKYELTDECIEKIADAIARKMKGEEE